MKKKVLLLGVLFILFISVGCAQKEEGVEVERTETEKEFQIGMSFDSFVIERWQKDRAVFVSTAKELGAEVNVQNANGDLEEQIAQIEYFIDKKMDVIVIICIDSDGLGEVVQKAKNAGIKVIAYDRLIKNAGVDLYISFDNEMVGTMMGEGVVSRGDEVENVLMLGGPLTDNNVSLVERGFERMMREQGIYIIDKMHADGWKAELGAEYVYDHVDMVERADVIMCGNDDIATAVFRALSEKRLAGKIGIVGQDADLAACQRIVQGTQIMTVYKPVEKLAQKAAECAIALGKGEEVEAETTIDDGSFQVPYVALTPVSVYRENMDDVIINSGFHLKEDVYLNIPAGRDTEKDDKTSDSGNGHGN